MDNPAYQKIYDHLLNRIISGDYKQGDRLPSESDLCESFSVSRITSKKSLEMLADNGYIKRIPGKGSFVDIIKNEHKSVPEAVEKKYWKIGVILEGINNVFGTEIFSTIESLAESKNFYLIPRIVNGARIKEEEAIQALLDFGVDGLILMTSHNEDISSELMKLVLNKIPLVLLDRFLHVIPAPFVGTDNVSSAKQATDYILSLGHKHISFLSRPYANTNTINRIAGFVKSHAEHGIAIDESIWITDIKSVVPGCYNSESIEEDILKIKNLIISNSDVTCFFASEYRIALIAKEAVIELGLHIPEDISIICFDGPDDFLGKPFFTRIVQREKMIGIKAVELLMEEIVEHTDKSNVKIFYDADLVIGKSTTKLQR